MDLLTRLLRAGIFANALLLCCMTGIGQPVTPAHYGSDHITSFHSEIRIRPDAGMLVTETIRVYNGDGNAQRAPGDAPGFLPVGEQINDEIKRGIVRTIPLYYLNQHHLFQNTDLRLIRVLLDGRETDHHEEQKSNGIVIYTGSKDVFLPTGYHIYTLTYETNRQLKDLVDSDELYWNVTGNGWSFAIDTASCEVVLPPGVTALNANCYTGQQGSSAQDCAHRTGHRGDTSVIFFRATRSFEPRNGLTIAVAWPKGSVQFPGTAARFFHSLRDNRGIFLLPLAAIFSFAFLFHYWKRYGKDPEKGVIYPRFEPPAGLSPAAVGYIHSQAYGKQFTAATLVDAAVRRLIRIDVEREGLIFKHNDYLINESGAEPLKPVSDYEDYGADVRALIGQRIEKDKFNQQVSDLNKKIEADCGKRYRHNNGSVSTGARGMFTWNYRYLTIPFLVCTAAAFFGFRSGIGRAVGMGDFYPLLYFIIGLVICIAILFFFMSILPAYSPEGRKTADHIEGFRMFLMTADEQRFNTMAPGDRSLELYERFLPFAIALNAEVEWGRRFKEVIEAASMDGSVASTGFVYAFASHPGGFASNFAGSFSGAISSASTPPSSSSSGSSGGFSGGGGGGGGGGGW